MFNKFNKKNIFIFCLVTTIGLAGLSYAALVGVQPGYPLLTFDNQGTLSYNATSDLLSIDAVPTSIRFPGQRRPSTVYPSNGSLLVTIRAEVDDSGALIGGVAGDDLIVVGEVDKDKDGMVDYAGVLLTGEVDEFGFLDSGGLTDMYDFRFYVTGGMLASEYYLIKDIGVLIWSENSSFTGDFAVDFSGGAKGNMGPIDVVCSLDMSVEGCVVIPPPPPSKESDCKGKLISMTIEYTGLGCEASSHTQKPRKVNCIGDPGLAEPVSILVTDKKGKKIWASETNVHVGDTILVEAAHGAGKKKHHKHKPKHIGNNTKVKVIDAAGNVIQEVSLHTSCSQPLNAGDQFGSIRIVSLTSTKGGEVTYVEPEPEEVCITELPYVEPPHCEGKIEFLQLRYTGGGCEDSNNTQDPDKVTCTGDANSISPVRIVATDPSGSYTFLDTGTPASVMLGGIVDVDAFNAGLYNLKGETKVDIYDVNNVLIEEVSFHTSCSQPLNLGDRFGSIEIFSMYNTENGFVAETFPVTYTYTITNTSPVHTIMNVSVVDDIFGPVPGSPIASIAPGESAELVLEALISQETANTATATGTIGDIVICEAIGGTVITEALPPVTPDECTTKVKAMLLKYIGPDKPNATVTIEASSFKNQPVTYTGVNLTDGTILSSPLENGYTIDASTHNKEDLGSKTTIYINDEEEILHTSCSTPFVRQAPAPLNDPKGDPSTNWFVMEFDQKD